MNRRLAVDHVGPQMHDDYRPETMSEKLRSIANTLKSEIFFVATAKQLANILMRESAKRSSTATFLEDLLSPGTLQRLQEYRLLVVPGQESYFELNQNASYTVGPRPQVGCLLRTNIWWSHLLNRPLVGLERFYLMGNGLGTITVPSIFEHYSEAALAAMTGNGMHVPCAGATFLSALVTI